MNTMKKLILVSIFCLIAVVLFRSSPIVTPVGATQIDQCNQVFEYPTKTDDFNDSRITINYHDSDQQIDVSAHTGYVITEVALEVPDDGFSGFHVYATGPITNFNPPGSHDITGAKVKVKKVCATPTPTVTPSPTPTPDYSCPDNQHRNEDKVCVCDSGFHPVEDETYQLEKIQLDGLVCEADPTPTPTPVQCTGECGGWSPRPEGEKSTTQAPVCTDGTTIQLPANPHVLRNGEEATVNFFITEGDHANIYWRVVGHSAWENAVSNVKPNADRFVSFVVHGLDPVLGYDFGIQQAKGCGGGQLVTAVIIDGPQPQLFRLSYWTWK